MPSHGDTGIWTWFAGLRRRSVVLSSACPPGECTARLALVTAQRGLGAWYRDPQNYIYHRGDPRLLGTVGAYEISVARFPEAAGRNSFAPRLEARLAAAGDGGTTLCGSIGLHPAVGVVLVVQAAVCAFIALVAIAAGVAMLVTGRLAGLLPVALAPLAWTVLVPGLAYFGSRSLNRSIPLLVSEVCGILGASASFPASDPASDPAPA